MVRGHRERGRAAAWADAVRVRQWPKNALVLAAPAAAGTLHRLETLGAALGALGVFCVLSAAVYLANDVADASADRAHPRKRLRPVAAGEIGQATAIAAALLLAVAGLGAGFAVGGADLLAVALAYIALSATYSLGLKRVAVVELGLVASGFVLRAVAGGAATDVSLSRWFAIVVSAGALYVVVGKRLHELRRGTDGRSVLRAYTPAFLEHARSVAGAVSLAAYCMWAFQRGEVAAYPLAFQLTTVPFALALLRFTLTLDTGLSDAPEEIFLRDRVLAVLVTAWIGLFSLAVAAG